MQTAADLEDDDAGSDLARDRHARIVRRMAYPLLALAAAGAIAWLGGCEKGPQLSDSGTKETFDVDPPAADWALLGSLTLFPDPDQIEMEVTTPGGVLALKGRGYVVTGDAYGPDFTVAYEYRFPDAASMPEEDRSTCNTGCLLFITGGDKVWPRCLEVQGRWDDTAQIKSNARDVQVTATLDEPARDAARRPPGEWNRVEIVSRGGALRVSLNGVQVSTSEPTELTRGRIGFQAEGFPVEFRDVTIAE